MAEQDQNTADAPRGPSVHQIPEGDSRQRLVCPDCGYIQYDNPKIIVGAVCTWQDRYLMCRRAIAVCSLCSAARPPRNKSTCRQHWVAATATVAWIAS